MKILYVSQYFPPEMGAPSARVHELSQHWVEHGHEVTVLTAFAHHPTGVKAPADRRRLRRHEERDGIRVLRTYVYATPNRGVVKRMFSYLSFMLSAMVIGSCRLKRPDVVIATSPQLLCACAGYALARRFRAPFVFEVRDLWPESILAVEAMKENLVVRGLRRIASFLYHSSDLVVTVGEGYKRQIQERYGVAPDKVFAVPNGVTPELFKPGDRDNEVREERQWGDRFVVLYLGTHGMAHDLETVVGAARRLSDDQDIVFVFVGEGAEKDRLVRAARDLTNVQFISQQPRERVPLFYAACDLGLVTLRNTPLFQDVLPSKLFEYMAMERPVLVTVGGEARALVEKAGAGRYVPPEDPDDLARAIRECKEDPEALRAMGEQGRDFVLAHFDRRRQAREYAEILRRVGQPS